MKNKKVQYLTLLLGWVLLPLPAQESPLLVALPEKEALFATELGDLDADLFVSGTWNISAVGSLGLSWRERTGVDFPAPFPLMQEGFLFRQVPDLTLSLWIDQRWFFETTMKERSEDNTFLMGYVGRDGEFVRSVLAGNSAIALSPYRYLDFPDADRRSPGIAALFATERSSHEFLLRYDPSALQRKSFIGGSERTNTFIPLSGYLEGRYFLLPDRDVEGLVLYLEDRNGTVLAADGRRYRRGDGQDFFHDSVEGTLTLRSPPAGRVLVHYRVGGTEVGPGTGLSFPWSLPDPEGGNLYTTAGITDFIETLESRSVLVVHEPGRLYPFQILGRYPLPAGTIAAEAIVRITDPSGEATAEAENLQRNYRFLIDGERGTLNVLRTGSDPEDPENRFPFLADRSWPYLADERFRSPPLGISIEVLRTTESYRIEGDAVPGSVQVYRNGRPERAFRVDHASGTITFDVPPRDGEEIEVIYRTYSGDASGGDVLFGTGHRISLTDLLSLELAAGLRWNVQDGAYTDVPDGRPGSLTASAALLYRNDLLRWEIDGALSYYAHNTTGILRLLGMEGEGLTIPVGGAVPASPSTGLTAGNRGILSFRDYRNDDGSYATWSTSGKTRYPYEDGSIPGPYPAASGSDTIEGPVTVLEYEIADGEWVGAQLPFSAFGSADLSRIEAMSFHWRAADGDPTDLAASLEIGSVSEDLDADGVLDEELNRFSAGFAFDHDGTRLLVGGGPDLTGNGVRESEDADGNGVLSRNTDAMIVSRTLDPDLVDLADSDWHRVTIRFTPGERARLTAVRGIRLLLSNSSGSARTGRIVVSEFELQGSPFAVQATVAEAVLLREIPESAASSAPPRRLEDEIPDSVRIFGTDRDDQRVLELSWGRAWDPLDVIGFGSDGFAEITGFTEPVPLWQYRELSVYLSLPMMTSSDVAAITLSFTDGAGRGITARFDHTDGFSDWRRLSINLIDRTILLNGERIPGTVTIDRNSGDLARFTLRIDGSSKGTLYLDEVHLSDAVESYRADSSFAVAWERPGAWLYAGGVPLLSNLTLNDAGAISGTFRGENPAEDSADADFSHETDVETDLLTLARVGGSFSVRRAGGETSWAGGHRVQVPAKPENISFSDSYLRSFGPLEERMERDTSFTVRVPEAVDIRAGAESELRDDRLLQSWDGSLQSAWEPPVLLALSAQLTQTADGYLLPDGSYPASWIDSYSLLGRWEGGDDEHRAGSTSLGAVLATRPMGLGLDLDLSFRNFPDEARSQENSGIMALALPLSFGDGPGSWTLTFGYERSFSHRFISSGAERFTGDLSRFGDVTGKQEYLFRTVPFGELFATEADELFGSVTDGLEQADYRPAASLTFGRQLGSDISDLFVPSSALLRLGKTLARDEDTVTSGLETRLTVAMTALNLFGSLGRYPVFPAYRTDEVLSELGWTLLSDPDFHPRSWEFSLYNSLGLYTTGGGMLLLSNRLRLWSAPGYFEEASIAWVWRTEPRVPLSLPYLPVVQPADYHYLHTETLTVTGTGSEEFIADEGALLRIGHETALRIPDRGSLRIFGRFGLGSRPVSLGEVRESQFIGGIEMGIEGEIRF